MQHMRDHTVWMNFFATKLVELEMIEADVEQDYETAKAVAYLETGDTKTVTEAKAKRDAAVAVKKARGRYRTARENRKVMEIARNNRERAANLFSRELSRRGNDRTSNRVDRNMP